jgi:tetratricopeptide (TPR) repeat protein
MRRAMLRDSRTALVFLCAVVLAAYFNALFGGFQFDDYNVIVHNPAVHSLPAWFDSMPGIRPLLKLSYALNWVSGFGAFGYHAVNIGVHAANAVLVYLLLSAFGRREAREDWSPFLAALLFALHPVQTEAVTYISGRSVSLMALFYLGAVLAYVRSEDSQYPGRMRALSGALFAAALLTKEIAVTLPLVLMLWDATNPQRRWTMKDMLKRQALHWLILLGGLIVLVASPTYRHLLDVSIATRTLWENLLSQANAVWYLAGQLLLPWRLNIDPDLPVIAGATPIVLLQALAILAVIGFGFHNLRRRPWVALAILWSFIHLLPTNSLLPRIDLANDRQLYLASIGVFFAAGVALQSLFDRIRRRWLVNAVVGLLLGLGFATVQRNEVYRSEITLWEDAAAKSPNKARVFNNLGFVYQQAGRLDDAEQAYRRALEIDPNHTRAHWNLENLRSTSPPLPPLPSPLPRGEREP